MKVILISAKSQHGKDTAANIMKEKLEERGEKVLVIHFGDPVKWFAKAFYGWDGQKDEAGRALLQYIGTTLMRTYNKYYWGNMISEFIVASGFKNDFTYALIPDWRFFSEKQAIEQHNNHVYTIRVERHNPDGSLYRNPNMTDEQFNHVSETELDKANFNWTILNSGSIEDLRKKILPILQHIDKC